MTAPLSRFDVAVIGGGDAAEAARVMTICNACRYCEQYCPAFQAMEQRLTFANADLNYLANLCHQCGECLYACQYAPPHEFAINVPRTLAEIRVRSYEQYAWPTGLATLFRRQNLSAALGTAVLAMLAMLGIAFWVNGAVPARTDSNFYAVVPHALMVALFGAIGLFVLISLAIGVARCWRDFGPAPPRRGTWRVALSDALTLKHLHVAEADCVSALEQRSPWRRRFHQATSYGFLLCFASTCVATLYHLAGSAAPYAYSSLPVLLGTVGGFGLLIGTAGLLAQRRGRDPTLSAPAQEALDRASLVLLLLTAASGLMLLALRGTPTMATWLIVHLGFVLALLITLPYGKLVHGLYRAAALVKYSREAS